MCWRLNAEVAPRYEQDVSDYSRTVVRAQVSRLLGKRVWLGAGYEHHSPDAPVRAPREPHLAAGADSASCGRLDALIARAWRSAGWSSRSRCRCGRGTSSAPVTRSRRESLVMAGARRAAGHHPRRASGPPQGFDRHRVGGGLGRALSAHVSIEGGYALACTSTAPPPFRTSTITSPSSASWPADRRGSGLRVRRICWYFRTSYRSSSAAENSQDSTTGRSQQPSLSGFAPSQGA